MRFAILLALAASLLHAHVISMSNGEATIQGARLDFVLRIPTYEIGSAPGVRDNLLRQFQFRSRGVSGQLTQESCHEDAVRASVICVAEYTFPEAVEQLDVECTLYQITSPNHVHLLKAENGSKRDQAVLDFSFPRTTLRFRPPTAMEVAIEQGFQGIMAAVAGPMQLLLLLSLAMAARSRKELIAMTAMFVTGGLAAVFVARAVNWLPEVRFVEAALALALSYLSVEMLMLPRAGMRWLVAGVLGGFHGLSLHLLLAAGGFRPEYVLSAAAAAVVAVVAIFAVLVWLIQTRLFARVVPFAASAMLAIGLVWFFLRVRN